MYSQVCHIFLTDDIQKAGFSADGIQYHLMQVIHVNLWFTRKKSFSVLAKQQKKWKQSLCN